MCKKVDYVPTVAVGIATSSQLKNTLAHGKNLQAKIETAKQKRLENFVLLSKEEVQLMKQVDKYEAEMVEAVHEMAITTKENIRKQHQIFKQELNEEFEKLGNFLADAQQHMKNIEKPIRNESQCFVDLSFARDVLKPGNKFLEEMFGPSCTRHLSYVFNNDILISLKKCDSFGDEFEKPTLTGEASKIGKPTLTGASSKTMCINRVKGDKDICYITDTAETADGTILLTDYNNHRLKCAKLFSGVQDWIDVPGAPMSVCHISDSEVAVSLREECKIQFVSTTQPMKLMSSFSTPDRCNRLCYDEETDELFVCCGGRWHGSAGEVHVFGKNGNLKRSFGKTMFSTPVDIKLTKERKTLFVADREKGIFVLDTQGNIKWSDSNYILTEIWGVADAGDDQVFTSGDGSDNVCMLSKEGRVLSKIENIKKPISIHLFKQSNQLLVCHSYNRLQIYTLKNE